MNNKSLITDTENVSELEELFADGLNHFVFRKPESIEMQVKRYKKTPLPKKDSGKILGVFSELLGSVFLSLYDEPHLVEKYPYGVVTECAVFVPMSLYQDMIKKEPKASTTKGEYRKTSFDGVLHIKNLLVLVENNFNITFTEDEKLNIISSYLYSSNWKEEKHQKLMKEIVKQTPQFFTMENWKKELKAIGIKDFTIEIMDKIGNKTDVINNILFKSREVHNTKNPLNKLAEKVIENENNISIEKMTVKKFQEIYNDGWNMADIAQSYDILNEIAKKELNSNKTNKEKIEGLKKNWVPLLNCLGVKHFVVGLENLGEILGNHKTKIQPIELENMIKFMNDNLSEPYSIKREMLIKSLTNLMLIVEHPTRKHNEIK